MAKAEPSSKIEEGFAEDLLRWYDAAARELPWRITPGEGRFQDPYLVLISETMLQQTTVATVRGRFGAFIDSFPTIGALASASESDVLAAWAGLGYYRRARSLHACARAIVKDCGGSFPQTVDELRELPGIGTYTAAAIASIAFGRRAVVVDTNVSRIVARVRRIAEPPPAADRIVRVEAEALMPEARYGDYAQALMDLGATICRPKAPQCLLCPARGYCLSAGTADAVRLPLKKPKKNRLKLEGVVAVVTLPDGRLVAEDRPASGLFAGMLGLPGGGWDGRDAPGWQGSWREVGNYTHVLTHRQLEIRVLRGSLGNVPDGYRAVSPEEASQALPTIFRRALEIALPPRS
jgi:A/G-specific adenine glycosylase